MFKFLEYFFNKIKNYWIMLSKPTLFFVVEKEE